MHRFPGVDPSRSLVGKRPGGQLLHLVGDCLRVCIRDLERELDLVVVLKARGLDALQVVCVVGRSIGDLRQRGVYWPPH
jgi:hypothetical protein